MKPLPFKARTKKIQMRKTFMLKIKEGYDYGLHENEELVVISTIGSYDRHFDEEEKPKSDFQGEYVEDLEELVSDVKPVVQETKVEDSSEHSRRELFEEIEALVDLANLSLRASSASDKFTNQDITNPKKMETCPSCDLPVTNLQKHMVIAECGLYPFPFSKMSPKLPPSKKGRE